jgi:hypothetical protein
LLAVSSKKGTIAVSELTATIRFPAYAASEVEAGVGICYRKRTLDKRMTPADMH